MSVIERQFKDPQLDVEFLKEEGGWRGYRTTLIPEVCMRVCHMSGDRNHEFHGEDGIVMGAVSNLPLSNAVSQLLPGYAVVDFTAAMRGVIRFGMQIDLWFKEVMPEDPIKAESKHRKRRLVRYKVANPATEKLCLEGELTLFPIERMLAMSERRPVDLVLD